MKKNFIILAAFILLNASLALAEWTGDTLQPEKKDGYYLISMPEEFVWIGKNAKNGDSIKLVNDIVFGKNKDVVNPLSLNAMLVNATLDFNGFSVYGATSYGDPFIRCGGTIKNLSYKNFRWEKYSVSNADAFDLKYCKTIGNVVAEGRMRIVDPADKNIYVSGYGIVDSVLVNRISIEVEAKNIGRLSIHAVPEIRDMGVDSLSVRGAVNYADISVKADSINFVEIYGMPEMRLNENFYKLANYGNITVDVKGGLGSISVFGLTEYVRVPKGVHPDIYNEGNISVQSNSISDYFNVSGLIGVIPESEDTLIFKKALNRGNISFTSKKKYENSSFIMYAYRDSHVGGCFGRSEGFIKNAVNQGEVTVSVPSVEQSRDQEKIVVGGIIGKSIRCISNSHHCVSGLSKVVNMGSVVAVAKGAMAGGVVGYTDLGPLSDEDYPGRIMNSANFGNVEGSYLEYLGGVVGNLFDSDASGIMNFGTILAKISVGQTGGVFGAIRGSCGKSYGTYSCTDRELNDVANLGNVFAARKNTNDSIGGITAASFKGNYWTSYNAGRVAVIDREDDFNSIIEYGAPMSYFYDINAFYGTDTLQKREFNENEADTSLTTAYMQSNKFVKDLNYESTQDSNAKIWKLSPDYPYPIIAEVEDLLKEHQTFLSIPPVRTQRAVASIKLSVEGMNVLVSGAKAGTPYAVFNLLGHSLSRGRLDGTNQRIPLSAAGTYIVKVGNATRKVTVNR